MIRDQLRNPTLGNQVWATFTFFIPIDIASCVVCLSLCVYWAHQTDEPLEMPFEGGLMCTQRTMQIVLTSCHYFTQRYQPLAWTFFYLMNYSNPVINLYSLLVDTILSLTRSLLLISV